MADDTRVRKVQDRIQQTVARLLGRRIKDPRLSMVTITDVRVTGDLQHASIFYTVMGGEDERNDAARAFESAKGMIRSEVGKNLGIRLTPSLEFLPDALPEAAAHLEDALERARKHDEEVAKLREGAEYAGDADPYRADDEEDEGAEEYSDEYAEHYADDIDAAADDADEDFSADEDDAEDAEGDDDEDDREAADDEDLEDDDFSDDAVDEALLESDEEDFNPDDDDDEEAEAEEDRAEDEGDDTDIADFEIVPEDPADPSRR